MKKILSIAMICTAMVLFCIKAPAPEGFKYQIIAYIAGLILFATALSSIRKFFKQELNVEAIKDKYKKCYSIEVMGRDKFNSDVYGIQLDPSDFDLGKFNYR